MKRNTLIVACTAALLLAFPAVTLWGGSEERAEKAPCVVLLDLLDEQELDCERVLRLVLGLGENEELDGEQIVRFLLGIDAGDEIDREQIIARLSSIEACRP